ncbi:hypothetical protein FRX31_019099 [Thalictrum thalictroides]|uniref:Phytocyanin domain-containing protein n=1 Tax=Thalictrum thalictroides TaxID=46969 RepID=A0A7J6W4R5_THATH|nr:hypothetical protein FRX31_019099 [Thalictrum thalictroides]
MAYKIAFFNVAVVLSVVIFPSYIQAKEFMVGDDSGWTIGFDYKTWAKDKEFHVGDKSSKLSLSQSCICVSYLRSVLQNVFVCLFNLLGDKLIEFCSFYVPCGAHNVHKVDAIGFQNCTTPAGAEALKAGSDVITLATPGKKWYLCGVSKYCEIGGQKLAITVLSNDQVAAPAPLASSSVKETVVSVDLLIAGVITIGMMVMT